MRKIISFLTILFPVLVVAANAQEGDTEAFAARCFAAAPDDAATRACVGAATDACVAGRTTGSTTWNLEDCIENEAAFWDGERDRALAEARARAQVFDAEHAKQTWVANQQEALVAFETAWRDYVDAACLMQAGYYASGSGATAEDLNCRMILTVENILWLRRGATGKHGQNGEEK